MKRLLALSLLTLILTNAFGAGTYIKGPALIEGTTSTATSGVTTTLTKDSQTLQQFTGASTQTVTLPNATTVPTGRKIYLFNRSSGVLTVNYFGGAVATTLTTDQWMVTTLYANGTSAGTWDFAKTSSGSAAITIGGPVAGSSFNQALYVDGSGNLAQSAGFSYDPSNNRINLLSGTSGAPVLRIGSTESVPAGMYYDLPNVALGLTTSLKVSGQNIKHEGGVFYATQVTTPAAPAPGTDKFYFKSDDNLYKLNSSNVESLLGGGGGGLTIGGAITGGTANRVLFEGAGNTLSESANLQFDGTTFTVANNLNFAAGAYSEIKHAGSNVAYVKSGGAGYFQVSVPIQTAASNLVFGAEQGTFAYPFLTSYFGTGGVTIGVPHSTPRAPFNPNYLLDIRGQAGNATIQLSNTASGTAPANGALIAFDGANLLLNNQAGGYLKFSGSRLALPLGSSSSVSITDSTNNAADTGWYFTGNGSAMGLGIAAGGVTKVRLDASGLYFPTATSYQTINHSGTSVVDFNNNIWGFNINVYADLGVRIRTTGTQPACAAGNRGTIWQVEGGTGVADLFQVCQKNAADAYSWVTK